MWQQSFSAFRSSFPLEPSVLPLRSSSPSVSTTTSLRPELPPSSSPPNLHLSPPPLLPRNRLGAPHQPALSPRPGGGQRGGRVGRGSRGSRGPAPGHGPAQGRGARGPHRPRDAVQASGQVCVAVLLAAGHGGCALPRLCSVPRDPPPPGPRVQGSRGRLGGDRFLCRCGALGDDGFCVNAARLVSIDAVLLGFFWGFQKPHKSPWCQEVHPPVHSLYLSGCRCLRCEAGSGQSDGSVSQH